MAGTAPGRSYGTEGPLAPGADSEPATLPPGVQWHATPGLPLALALLRSLSTQARHGHRSGQLRSLSGRSGQVRYSGSDSEDFATVLSERLDLGACQWGRPRPSSELGSQPRHLERSTLPRHTTDTGSLSGTVTAKCCPGIEDDRTCHCQWGPPSQLRAPRTSPGPRLGGPGPGRRSPCHDWRASQPDSEVGV